MTYKTALSKSKLLTDKQAVKIYKDVVEIYNLAYKDVSGQLAKIYAKYNGDYNELIKYERLGKLLNSIDKEMSLYNRQATKLLNKNSELNITDAYYRNQFVNQRFGAASDINLSFSALNPYIVESSVYGTAESWQKIQNDAFLKKWGNPKAYQAQSGTLTNELMKKHNVETLTSIRQAITSNLIQGNSYTESAKQIKNIIGSGTVTKNAIDVDGMMYKALRIAQTEGTRNWNSGAYATDQWYKRQDPDAKREWLASLDSSTRDSHASLDGVEENENGGWTIGNAFALHPGGFGVAELDIDCRCTTILKTDIPDNARIARNPETGKNEVFEWGNYNNWKKMNGLKTDKYGIVKA